MKTASRLFYESGKLPDLTSRAVSILENCTLCPRNCRVNRIAGEHGLCATGRQAKVASWGAHFGEEEPLVGEHGSGTIFLASCSLRCCFCQNYETSHSPGEFYEVSNKEMAEVMLELQAAGCHNINFVTPSHVVPQILEALIIAFGKGLNIPLVYNCSSYENPPTLKLLAGIIDIYMPDFKFWLPASAEKYADAPNYPEVAKKSVRIMHQQVGDLVLDGRGLASKGMIIRHLMMPEAVEETRQILGFIASEISTNTYMNIMDQYRPCGMSQNHPELDRGITPGEMKQALLSAEKAGLGRLDQRDPGLLLKLLGIT
jgi:putative pyruvate formate lyase activating enzyme